jgi:hypothetical protein
MVLSAYFLALQTPTRNGLPGKSPLGLPRLALFALVGALVAVAVFRVQLPVLEVGEEGEVQVILRQFKLPPTCCQIFFMSSQVPVAQGVPLQSVRLLLETMEAYLVFQ